MGIYSPKRLLRLRCVASCLAMMCNGSLMLYCCIDVRREPVEHVHPIVRKHPVTGEEALYVNRQFTRRIVGLKKEESGSCITFITSS